MAYIEKEIVEDILNQADIVQIIQEYGVELKKHGSGYRGFCPFHHDVNNPSFIVSPKQKMYNCFSCKQKPTGGNTFNFVARKQNVSYKEAIQIVAKKINYPLKISDIKSERSDIYKNEFEMYNFAMRFFLNNLNIQEGLEARKYLKERGIDESIIKEFKIGLALPEKDTLYQIMLKNNYQLDVLDEFGLVNKVGSDVFDTFINRIIIPIEDLQGRVVAFTGRIFHNEKTAKYLNTKKTPLYIKSNILFNYHNALKDINNEGKVIIVEGNMDAIKLSAKGIKNVIALMGVSISLEQVSILKRLNKQIILMLDNDQAGLSGTLNVGDELLKAKLDVSVVRLSDAKDPDEYIEKFGIEKLKNNLKYAPKLIDFKLEYLKKERNLNNYADLSAYLKDVIQAINVLDDLEKNIILKDLSEKYNIDINYLKNEMPKNKEKKKIVKQEIINEDRLSKYERAAYKVLYGMMNNSLFITIYKKKLGFFKNKIERIIASEIVYYNNEFNNINMASFLNFVMNNNEIYDKVMEIVSKNNLEEIQIDEFEECIKVILEEKNKDEIKNLKVKMKQETDINKKEEILKKIVY